MSGPSWRLFIAHPVPPAARDILDRSLQPYRAHARGVRWTRPESWHLTLLFLGTVTPARVGELGTIIEQVAAERAPYHVTAAAGGGRISRGEGVGWLALDEGAATLIELAGALADRCPRDMSSGPAPRRTPSAHLTIARRADRAVIEALRRQVHGPLALRWRVDRIGLVRSQLEPDGARYETLHEFPL